MRSPLAARLSGDELGGRPRNYGHLLGLAARYARTWLDGLTVVNAETGWPIGLRWSRGLENAVAPGVPPVLLQAVPALPKMLAEGRYLGTFEDGPPRLPVRWLHSFAAAATVAGQPHEAMLIVREDPLGRLFFDGFLARGSGIAAGKTVGGRLDPRATRGAPRASAAGGRRYAGFRRRDRGAGGEHRRFRRRCRGAGAECDRRRVGTALRRDRRATSASAAGASERDRHLVGAALR